MLLVLIFVFAVLVYFLPVIVSNNRNTAHHGAISAVTLLLGWTVVGWAASLIWACTDEVAGDPARVRCPFCDESVSPRAVVCPHCRRELAGGPVAAPAE